MGGNTSKDAFEANGNGGPSMSRMDSEDEDCRCQGFFCNPPKQEQQKKKKDMLGTPIPDTPLVQRLKRRELLAESNREAEVYSSKYFGLEKERSSNGLKNIESRGSSLYDEYERQPSAVVHEGKVRSPLLMNFESYAKLLYIIFCYTLLLLADDSQLSTRFALHPGCRTRAPCEVRTC